MNNFSKKCFSWIIVISLLLGCARQDEKIDRRGGLICEFQIEVSSKNEGAFANIIRDIGDQSGLKFHEDIATEKATAKYTGRVIKVMYLVKKYETSSILVLAANNASSGDIFSVQVYAGAISSSVGAELCEKTKSMQRGL